MANVVFTGWTPDNELLPSDSVCIKLSNNTGHVKKFYFGTVYYQEPIINAVYSNYDYINIYRTEDEDEFTLLFDGVNVLPSSFALTSDIHISVDGATVYITTDPSTGATIKGKWRFQDALGAHITPGGARQGVNFTAHLPWTEMWIDTNADSTVRGIYYRAPKRPIDPWTTAWTSSTGWVSEAYRDVDFGSTPQYVSDDFYEAFTTIAEEVVEEEGYADLIGKWRFNDNIPKEEIQTLGYEFKNNRCHFVANGVTYSNMCNGYDEENDIDRSLVYTYWDGVSQYAVPQIEAYQYVIDNHITGEGRSLWADGTQTIEVISCDSEDIANFIRNNATKVEEETAPTATFDLSTLNLSAGTHRITVKARANGYADSAESEAVEYTIKETGITHSGGSQ